MTLQTETRAKSKYFARSKYDEIESFHFHDLKEFRACEVRLEDCYDKPVDVYKISYLEGPQKDLFHALKVPQTQIGFWYKEYTNLDRNQTLIATRLAEHGYSIRKIPKILSEYHLVKMHRLDFAYKMVYGRVPKCMVPFINIEAYANHLENAGHFITEDRNTIIAGDFYCTGRSTNKTYKRNVAKQEAQS